MNIHDNAIELPPLPEDLIAQTMLATEVRSLLRQYGKRCWDAAIEADRKRRGEPVARATVYELDGRWQVLIVELGTEAAADLVDGVYDLYAAPQPAEPVKVPSDAEIIALALSSGIRKSEEHWGDRYYTEVGGNLIGFARALLSRYGDSQPATIGKQVGYVLIEDGKAVAFFDEIPPGHYHASAFVPVGIIGQPAASAEPVGYLIHGKASHDEYVEDRQQAHRRKEQRIGAFSGEDETEIIPLYSAPVAAPVAQEPAFYVNKSIIDPRTGKLRGGFNDAITWSDEPAHDWRLPVFLAPVAAQEQPAPMEAIGKLLTVAMEIAVANGANSVSMPDEYVEVAAWLFGIPVQHSAQDREDAERLNFIEEEWFWRDPSGVWTFGFNECWDAGKHDNLRAAIDAARAAAKGVEVRP